MLALLGHMTFEGCFGFGKELRDEFRGESGPGCVKSCFDGVDPGGWDRATRYGVQELRQVDFILLVIRGIDLCDCCGENYTY